MPGWIGVDLDGTIAEYNGWQGPTHIGRPIPVMVGRVKRWLEEGREVRIFTARVAESDPQIRLEVILAIQDWLEAAGLPRLSVTNVKDFHMVELWDDRAVQVRHNTGRPVR